MGEGHKGARSQEMRAGTRSMILQLRVGVKSCVANA
jgi:hypothetical protein